jgi:site-specific DNA-cytosine methylase
MKVLSLFDGMSCLQIALKEHGFIVDKYYASEIDKFAIKQTQHNFPDTIQLGSVTEWRTWNIDWSSINLIGAGSPCQGFGFAGKQLAFDDPRSKLFFVFVEILNHCRKFNPEVRFLLENVDMKKDHLRIISEYVGIFPTKINSALVSAQNRERWYWSNIRTKQVGLFDELYTDIPQPEDRGILLRDILQPENEIDKKYYLSDKMLNYFDKRATNFNNGKVNVRGENDKASTITASCKSIDISDNFIKCDRNGAPKADQNKASSLTIGGHGCGNHSDMDVIMTKNYAQWDASGKGYKSQQDRAFYEEGKHGTLSSSRSENKTGVF